MFNFNIALVLFVGFELCYYLLIAQTGIVEVFHSDMAAITFLPLGGITGSYLASHIKLKEELKVYILLGIQTLATLVYPDLTPVSLLVLGIAVGGMAPLMINTLRKASSADFIFALGIAYTAGTSLFNSDPFQRESLGLALSFTALLSYFFIDSKPRDIINKTDKEQFIGSSLLLMSFWVFLDSALFETLSRDISIPIWRGGFTFEIIIFHIIGVIAGVLIKLDTFNKSLTILILFALSYLFYLLREPLLLSIIYPFVISFYNVAVLQTLVSIKNLKTIGIYMIFIGWIASGAGLFAALQQLVIYVPILFLVIFFYITNQQTNFKLKEAYHG